jgi:GNAT superfamily N-acetyltransferase
MIEITPLRETDRPGWQPLAVGYNAFYERVPTDADYDRTWRRLMKGEEMHGLAARLDGRVVGIAHYMFHASIWFDDVCYLADLFVDETVRGQGAARALIEAVATAARARGCPRFYWLTKQDNARARTLYDKVARFAGFIRYDYPMG